MSVKVRKYRNTESWEVDIRIEWPDGTRFRERKCAPGLSRTSAQRWGEARERAILMRGKPEPTPETKEVPTFAEFAPRFVQGHAVANRQKPSSINAKETILRVHIVPRLGAMRLDELRATDVQKLKAELANKSEKTVNNVLCVLSKMLKVALEWDELKHLPCRVGLLKVSQGAPPWYEAHDYQRLVEGAEKCDPRIELLVLLGGDAGLRRGEIIALRWSDVDLSRRILLVQRSVWREHETIPKGGRGRTVPMTDALLRALKAHRHLRGERVLLRDDGGDLTAKVVRNWLERAQRRAGLEVNGGIHRLRHTFCSLLAVKSAPAKAIQELAGHADLLTTMKYMHLSPSARERAIELLNEARAEATRPAAFGEGVEKAAI